MDINPILYNFLIDPLLIKMREIIGSNIPDNAIVIDIACGTGAQSFYLVNKCRSVTGIDIWDPMITYAEKKRQNLNIHNLVFNVADANDLSQFADKEFDYSIMTLALHQFPPSGRYQILKETIRISKKIIITDYAVPQPRNLYGWFVPLIERLAGVEHYKNFKDYTNTGGVQKIALKSGLKLTKQLVFGKRTFVMKVY